MDLAKIRNLGIAAHIDAGKTTVSERILFDAGVERRMGNVDEGTTALDWMPQERERGITITAAATTVPWRGHSIHLIDTPGHVDFTVEVERSMRVLDGAILVIDAVMGVQAQSEAVWRQMRRHHVPYVVFVNKLDRVGADYLRSVLDVAKKFSIETIPTQYPLFQTRADGSRALRGLVDLLDLTTWTFEHGSTRASASDTPLPAEASDDVLVLRAELIEKLAEGDEEILGYFSTRSDPPREALVRALRARVIGGQLVPCLCGVALQNLGIHPLLDAVVDYLPSPLDLPPIEGIDPESGARMSRPASFEAPLSALAFKLMAQPHGDLTFVRIYSGTLKPGESVWNPRTKKAERVARILRMHANVGVALDEARAGDIVALAGLKHVATGDTLCPREAPILLEAPRFPDAVLSLVVEPSSSNDRDKLRAALQRLAHEDPTFHVREDADTGQWVISGMGELHLDVIRHRLEHEFHVRPSVGRPRVAYRESVVVGAHGSGRVERAIGGKDVHGALDVSIEPDPAAAALRIEWGVPCAVPLTFRRAIEETLALDGEVGPRFGFPLIHARLVAHGGASDPKRDAEVGFVHAASLAFRDALQRAEIGLLEPWMAFEIQVPSEFSSGAIADLNARGAQIEDVTADGALRTLKGGVALSKMFGYSTAVRSLSQGRASFSMTPAAFRAVPDSELEARGLVWR